MGKDLKTSVRLDTKSAVRSLQQLEDKINRIQRAVNKTSTANNKFSAPIQKATRDMQKLDSSNRKAANSANQIAKGYQKSSNAASVLTKNLRTLISTYVGIMGAKAVLNTSDLITSAENKLNYVNGGDAKLTQQTMDKTYAAAQRSRGAFSDMLTNVSKTMVLAGDSFDNNVDNAIRFQEIMSKAYTVGGASAAEQSSSMYQLVQALGSGVLQGDELRSVREGAPIAYKEIEKFAQGVYKTEDSLKDLASQGKITSDIVVAAIMNAGESIDTAFGNTKMTFGQAFNQIKNMAIQAFTPVLQMLNDALNSDAGKAIVDGIGKAFVVLANIVLWVGDLLGRFFSWCADNWYWLQWIVFSVVVALTIYFGVLAAKAIWAGIQMLWAFLTGLSPLTWAILIIGAVVAAIVWLANTTCSACEFMFYALMIVALGILLIGIITGSTALMIAAAVIAVIALILVVFMEFGQQIMGGIYVVGAFFVNVWNGMKNVAIGVWEALKAIAHNIKVAFVNAWYECKAKFWDFVSSVYSGVLKVANLINKVLGVFGIEINTSGLENAVNTAKGNAEANRAKKLTYQDISSAYSAGASTYDAFESGWASNAYANGAAKGAEWQNAIENFGTSIKDSISGFSLGGIGDKLGGLGKFGELNYSGVTGTGGSYLPDPNDPAYGVGGGYDPKKVLDNIAGDTGSIADSMDLTEEDLEYLRKIADMEWKKEFTTASIHVDMSNYNTVNGESDLDGIVTKLSDKLYEELNAVANGVYE